MRTSNCSLLLIYLPRKDERLSRPGWLTLIGLSGVVTRQPQVERRTAKVRLSETDVLPLCHAAKHKIIGFNAYCVCLYDAGLWIRYKNGTLITSTSCCNKCLKLFFGYKRRDSITKVYLIWVSHVLLYCNTFVLSHLGWHTLLSHASADRGLLHRLAHTQPEGWD